MRSNIARTCGSSRVPAWGPRVLMSVARSAAALELRKEVHHRVELLRRLLLQRDERRHRRGRVDERPRDRLLGDAVRDMRQLRAGPAVAVLADLVAGQG